MELFAFIDKLIEKSDVNIWNIIENYESISQHDRIALRTYRDACIQVNNDRDSEGYSIYERLFSPKSISMAIEAGAVKLLLGAIIESLYQDSKNISRAQVKGALVRINQHLHTNFQF